MNRSTIFIMMVLALATLGSTGCSDPTGCDIQTKTIELVWGDDLVNGMKELQLEWAREDGYDCESEPLRNAFGREIGERWICTRCRN